MSSAALKKSILRTLRDGCFFCFAYLIAGRVIVPLSLEEI